ELARKQSGNQQLTTKDLTQDEDVLDTWFSSWLWPMQVFKGITNPGNKDIEYYYPGSVLVTGQDIIFFWVARMIMAGMEYKKEKPFGHVYFTGMVRDKLGRKMSKQLGNSPDLLNLIDKYGADAVRFGIMISSPAGNDLLFDETSPEQGRNFNNKIWNALKLVKMWQGRIGTADTGRKNAAGQFALKWFEHRLNQAQAEVSIYLKDFKLSEALKTIYSLIWDDFCSWYLEWVKPGFEEPVDPEVYKATVRFFTELMHLLHPYMPFITEEVYHLLEEREDDLCVRQSKQFDDADKQVLTQGVLLQNAITAIRDVKVKNKIKPKEACKLSIQTDASTLYEPLLEILSKQLNLETLTFTKTPVNDAISLVVGKDKFYLFTEQPVDTGNQREALQKQIEYLRGFLESVNKKLSNEKFIQGAKAEVISLEQRKKEDAEMKIKVLEESLAGLRN
ncbi:MAG: class I tRNA ligase family protein, partial [Flavitalea sp.]